MANFGVKIENLGLKCTILRVIENPGSLKELFRIDLRAGWLTQTHSA